MLSIAIAGYTLPDAAKINKARPVNQDKQTDYYKAPYVDRGCREAPSCLRCPLVTCVHDDPHGPNGLQERGKSHRREAIALLIEKDLTKQQAADYLGLSIRTVHRALARIAEGQ